MQQSNQLILTLTICWLSIHRADWRSISNHIRGFVGDALTFPWPKLVKSPMNFEDGWVIIFHLYMGIQLVYLSITEWIMEERYSRMIFASEYQFHANWCVQVNSSKIKSQCQGPAFAWCQNLSFEWWIERCLCPSCPCVWSVYRVNNVQEIR